MQNFFEAINEIPGYAQKEEMIDGIYTQFQKQATVAGQLTAMATNAAFYGILDALTGMLGVKLFAPKSTNEELWKYRMNLPVTIPGGSPEEN